VTTPSFRALSDNFEGVNGTELINHSPQIGGPWSIVGAFQSFKIISNRATVDPASDFGAKNSAPILFNTATDTVSFSFIIVVPPITSYQKYTVSIALVQDAPVNPNYVSVAFEYNYGPFIGENALCTYYSLDGTPGGRVASIINNIVPAPNTPLTISGTFSPNGDIYAQMLNFDGAGTNLTISSNIPTTMVAINPTLCTISSVQAEADTAISITDVNIAYL
jgi:hypothetical protein